MIRSWCLLVVFPVVAAAQVATFSIVAYDPANADWGVAVASRYFSVGSVVPWAAAQVGAIATQANVNVAAGNPGAICPQIFGGIGVTAQGTHSDNLLLSLTSPTAFAVSAGGYAGTITISAQAT